MLSLITVTFQAKPSDGTKYSSNVILLGGIPFPLVGESTDYVSISPRDIKILLRNSQVVIDETNFAGTLEGGATAIQKWRELAGFTSASELPVLNDKAVYSIDNIMGKTGSTSGSVNPLLFLSPSHLLFDVMLLTCGFSF